MDKKSLKEEMKLKWEQEHSFYCRKYDMNVKKCVIWGCKYHSECKGGI